MGRRETESFAVGWHALRSSGRAIPARFVRVVPMVVLGAILGACAAPARALAGDGASPCAAWGLRLPWANHACGCCPDDYCQKPLPPVACPPCGTSCDTYCRKPLPGVPCLEPACSPDCYRVKPLPPCPRACEPWYICGPRQCCDAPRNRMVETAPASLAAGSTSADAAEH